MEGYSRQLQPAVFFDRDGTLIEDRGYLRAPEEVRFFPDTCEALARLRAHYAFFLVTNQRGVAEGIMTMEEVERVNEYVRAKLGEAGIEIREVYVCPHRREDGCECIKPRPYFLQRAAREHGIDLGLSYMIGDHPHDVECAANAGARGIYVLTGHGERHRGELRGDFPVVRSLSEAASLILRERNEKE